MTDTDMVLAILQATHDGDDLTFRELKLTENAVNGFLTPEGQNELRALYARIMKNG